MLPFLPLSFLGIVAHGGLLFRRLGEKRRYSNINSLNDMFLEKLCDCRSKLQLKLRQCAAP